MATETETYRTFAQDRLRANARNLQRLVDQFNRTADSLDTVPSAGRSSHHELVGELLHDHATWLSNAHLEIALGYAARADAAMAADRD